MVGIVVVVLVAAFLGAVTDTFGPEGCLVTVVLAIIVFALLLA